MNQTNNSKIGSPVFVVGHSRSGTTLVATLIGRHPNISMPPETQFFPEIYESSDATGPELAKRALENPRVRDLALDEARFMADFRNTPMAYKDVFELIIRSYCAKVGKHRPGEKSPTHLRWADTLLEWFPDAKIIGVVRDGRDVANSLMAVPWSHNNIIKHSFDWSVSQARASQLMLHAPDHFRIVKYENLLSAPEKVLKEVCEFLSEPFFPAMLDSGTSDAVPTWEAGWKEKARLNIDPSNIGKWKKMHWYDRAVMNTLMHRQLKLDGYDVSLPNPLIRAGVWLMAWPFHPKLRPAFSRIKSLVLGRAR